MTLASFQPSPRTAARLHGAVFALAAALIVGFFILAVAAAASGWLGYPGWVGPVVVDTIALTLLVMLVVDDRRATRRLRQRHARRMAAVVVPDDISALATASGVMRKLPPAEKVCSEHQRVHQPRDHEATRPCGHASWDPCFSGPCTACAAGVGVPRSPRASRSGV